MTTGLELTLVVVSVSAATAIAIFFIQDLMRPWPGEPDMKMVRDFIAQNVPDRARRKARRDSDRAGAIGRVTDDTSRPPPYPLSAVRKTELVVSIIAGSRTVQEVADEQQIDLSLLYRWVAHSEDAIVQALLEKHGTAGRIAPD